MDLLKAELHCHNVFSNSHLGNSEPYYDCNVTLREQLESAYENNIDALFVTNHNTLDGYSNLLEQKNNHAKFAKIQIYPAEEVSTNTGAHLLVYGISDAIKPGLPIDEILDEVKKQDAVSSAAHPFSLVDALRADSKKCDLIEVFNSNNIDLISNAKSAQFAEDNNMVGVAGSDSHVLSSLGRCLNEIESENTLDAVLHSMKHKKIRISKTGYTQQTETMEHLRYKIINSKEYIQDYLNEHYSNSKWLFLIFHKLFEMNPNSVLWTLFYKIAVLALKRISQKVNVKNHDMSFMNERQLSSIIKMAI